MMARKTKRDSMPKSADPPRCPWCSAALASTDQVRCPSCAATLREAVDEEVPGVTSIDHEAILRSRRPVSRPSGLIGWLSGGYQEAPESPVAPHTFSPPDADVKREMLRMELAAIEARVEAQHAELRAELAGSPGEQSAAAPGSTADAVDPDLHVGNAAATDAAEIALDEAADDAAVPPPA